MKRRSQKVNVLVPTYFNNCVSQHLCGAGSVGRNLNLPKLNYQYLTTGVAVVLVIRSFLNGQLVLFCVQCCVCRKRLSSYVVDLN